MKFLLVLAVVALAVYLWSHKRKQASRTRSTPPRMAQAMVACARCGLHLPQADAVQQDARWYCCAAHAEARPPARSAAADGSESAQP